MKRKNAKRIFMIVLLFFISIGFAYLSANLDIKGIANVKKIKWNIYFDNVQIKKGENFQQVIPTTTGTNTTELNFRVALEDPGDSYSFDVDIVNDGTVDAMFELKTDNTVMSDEQKNIYDFDIRYSDGIEINKYDLLASNSRDTITITVTYKKDIDISDLPSSDSTVNYSIILSYEQANIKGKKAVKRLHNYTITYDLDGGINNVDNLTTYTEKTETFSLKDPTKEGYTFVGWEDQQDHMKFDSKCVKEYYTTTINGVNFNVKQTKENNKFNYIRLQLWSNNTYGNYTSDIKISAENVNSGYTYTGESGFYYLNFKGNTNLDDCNYFVRVYLEKNKVYIVKWNLIKLTDNEFEVENLQFYQKGGSTVSIPIGTIAKGSSGNRTFKAIWQAN